LQDCPTPSLSLSPLSTPIGDELPPRRTPTTALASHPDPCTSPSLFLSPTSTVHTPVETEASASSQPLLPRHQRPLATVEATQSMPAAPTGRRSRSRPRPDHVEHAPWTPRACTAFLLVHTSSPLAPHTILHGIERAFTRHTCPALLPVDVSSP
jgi:hypothetical protein